MDAYSGTSWTYYPMTYDSLLKQQCMNRLGMSFFYLHEKKTVVSRLKPCIYPFDLKVHPVDDRILHHLGVSEVLNCAQNAQNPVVSRFASGTLTSFVPCARVFEVVTLAMH